MDGSDKINILLVDDQPAKLLSLRSILEQLDENVLQARSAEEALKVLLNTEVAVVLVDVCMPRMDGFELAELIREHPRFQRTAIIFISAVHLTDDDRLRGYGLGAVDYIPVPIIPEVLRAKVAVFADLYRKTEQLERLNRTLEQRVAERTSDLEASHGRLAETERRYRELVHALPAAVYTCDAAGRVTLYNQAAVELWGRVPALDLDQWCGSLKVLSASGLDLEVEQCPMAVTLREGRPCPGQEIVIERPDGSRRHVLPNPQPIFDGSGNLVGAVNMLLDITEHKAAQEALRQSEDRFRTLADNMAQLAWMADADGSVTWVNRRWSEYTGQTPAEAVGRGWTRALHPEDAAATLEKIDECFRSGEAWEHTVRTRAADGTYGWFLCRASPTKDDGGRVRRWFGTATDVTEQREAQQVLARDRESLEALVVQRTAELARSNERLRMADRMATIGTLSAGLGHDMANLLLPVRMRLEAIEPGDVAPTVREDLEAIGKACDYLQRLAKSLRLLAMDPEREDVQHTETDLPAWWEEAEGMIRNGLPRSASLEAVFPKGLPRARIGKSSLAQMMFNLVQNAGDALTGRTDGRVEVRATAVAGGEWVQVSVKDNGPGMDALTRDRCMEPFFTTKTRGLSTGLGLALVGGILKRVGGEMEIDSVLGKGTEFRLTLPAASDAETAKMPAAAETRVAMVCLTDRRLSACVESILTSMSFQVVREGPPESAEVWVTAHDAASAATVRAFAEGTGRRKAIVFGAWPEGQGFGVVVLDPGLKPSQLRVCLREALSPAVSGAN